MRVSQQPHSLLLSYYRIVHVDTVVARLTVGVVVGAVLPFVFVLWFLAVVSLLL